MLITLFLEVKSRVASETSKARLTKLHDTKADGMGVRPVLVSSTTMFQEADSIPAVMSM